MDRRTSSRRRPAGQGRPIEAYEAGPLVGGGCRSSKGPLRCDSDSSKRDFPTVFGGPGTKSTEQNEHLISDIYVQ